MTRAIINNKQKRRRVVLSVLVFALVLLFGVIYYFIKPEYDVSRATKTVNDLFVDTDPEEIGAKRIKETRKNIVTIIRH